MTAREREIRTLSFSNEGLDRGVIEESMEPWDKTVRNWAEQGYDTGYLEKLHFSLLPTDNVYHDITTEYPVWQDYYNTMQTQILADQEAGLDWDPVYRITFRIPFACYETEILEDTDEYQVRRDRDGWIRKYPKNGGLVTRVRQVVLDMDDWEKYKADIRACMDKYFTDENMEKAYGPYREIAKEYPVRLRISGFFWTPRFLMDNEEQLYAYYEDPDLLHNIAQFQADVYKEQLEKLLKIVVPSVVFFEEDLSGKTGPMISPATFEEFCTPYYEQVIPVLRKYGVPNIIMDTDGDFTLMIPKILEAGLDGVLPVDVNAGVDIVKVREEYPTLKFMGGFNKLCIIDGPEAIEAELERLKPVIAQGGCIVCTDHQAAPATSLENYRYYTRRLKEVVADLRNENVTIK